MDERLQEAPIGVLTVEGGVVTAHNEPAADILTVEDPGGDAIDEVFPQSVADSLPEAVTGESVTETRFEEYYPAIDRWLSVSVAPTGDTATVYVDDVTERKRHEQARERLTTERERLAVVDRLIADVLRELVGAGSRDAVAKTIRDRLGASDRYRFAWTGEHAVDGLVVDGVAGEPGETFPAVSGAVERGETTPETQAVENQSSRVVQSLSGDESIPESVRVAGFADGVQSALAVPLAYGSSVYGVVGVYAGVETAFTDHEQSSFEALGELAGLAINAVRNRRLLLSDTVTEVTFEVGSDSPLTALCGACETELTLDGTVPDSDGALTCFFSVSSGDPGAVVDAARSMSGLDSARPITGTEGDGGRVELTLAGEAPLVEAAAHGATVRTATFADDTGRVVVELAADADVRRLATALGGGEPATVLARRDRVRSARSPREFRDELRQELTDRQATVLQTAYLADYFESPRGSTAEEVADSLGITGSTLLHHLRASQRKLLDVFYESEVGDPS